MGRGAGEPSTKRAKADEADKEEDPLVRRKEELVVAAKEARSREDARAERVAKKELVTLCADFEAKNEGLFRRLPPELWQKIVDENLHPNDLPALAMTCRFFREKQKDLGKKMVTDLTSDHLCDLLKSERVPSHSMGWFEWVCDTFEFLPGFNWSYGSPGITPTWLMRRVKGAVHEGDLLNYAVFQGSIEILRWLVEEKGWEPNPETDQWAGLGGSIEVLEYLWETGNLGIWGGEREHEFTRDVCAGAARGGHLEALKWARSQDPPFPWYEETCTNAAAGGHLNVLRFLRAQDPPCPWGWLTCAWAAKGGHLDILKWARSQDPPCPWNEWSCANAARRGHLDVLKWLRRVDPPCPWDERTCQKAAKGGHLEVLKWARSEDLPCPWNSETCAEAAAKGRMEVLKWLRRQDPPCPWNSETCTRAAKGGHLEILKWARSEDPPCPWDVWTCAAAAEGGHLEVLHWLREQDPPCPWGLSTCSFSARGGHLEVLKYLRGLDPPCPWDRDMCRELASQNGHEHVIEWIDQQPLIDPRERHWADSDSDIDDISE